MSTLSIPECLAPHHAIAPRLTYGEVKRFFALLWRIHASLRSGRYAILHLNCSFTLTATPRNLLMTWVARRARVPYIVHLHGTFRVPAGGDLVSRQYRMVYRRIFDSAAWILALGRPSYRSICALGRYGDKTTGLMPNFVDFRVVPQRSRADEGTDGRIKVVYSGTLVASKGIYTLAAVAERVPDVVFQLVGDGPADSRDKFVRHLEGRGLADRVELLEARPNDRVLALLAEADVFFFPSMREGLPFSVLEAMAVGLPVVASNVGAIAEIVDVPAGGVLLQPEDVDGFARALNRLRLQPTLRRQMGEHNRAKAEQHYDYDVVVKQLCRVYDEVLDG